VNSEVWGLLWGVHLNLLPTLLRFAQCYLSTIQSDLGGVTFRYPRFTAGEVRLCRNVQVERTREKADAERLDGFVYCRELG
jgi:hypothetical protein